MVTLYGAGAVQIHYGKDTYSSGDGVFKVPHHLVGRALAMGFTLDQRSRSDDPVEAVQPPTAAIVASTPMSAPNPAVVASVGQLHDALRQFSTPDIHADPAKVDEFQALLADGWSEHEARELVWPIAEAAE